MLTTETPWYVLQVRSNREKRVAQLLGARAVENYLPLYRERVRWTDRTVVAERPLFPGYVFVRLQRDSKMIATRTPGVVRSLGDEEGDLVSNAELEKIRAGLASGYILRPHRGISEGTRVRVRRGLFEGQEGIVESLRQHCTLVLALAAVRRSFSMQVALDDVEVLKSSFNKVSARVYGTNRSPVRA